MSEIIRLNNYKEFKAQFDEEVKKSAEGFVRIGYLLKVARDTDVLMEGGYKTVAEFAQAEYGLRPDLVSRFMAINDRFAKNGYSDELEDKYAEFGYAKLSEMLTLPENVADALPEDLTRKEIQEVKAEYKAEKQISDLEVLMEEQEEGSTIMQMVKNYFHEHPDDYVRIHEPASDGLMGYTEEVINALAPTGTITIVTRVKGQGKMLLTVDTKKDVAQLVSMRSDASEAVDLDEIAAAVMALTKKDGDGKKAWSDLFGEEFPEIAPVQKSAKVKTPPKEEKHTDEGGNTITPAKKPLGDVSEAVPEEITSKQIIGSSPKKELTEEQKYDREQAKIDKQTKERLEEMKEEAEKLPSERPQIVHEIRLAEMYWDDVIEKRKTFELRKQEGYHVGDGLVMQEYSAGNPTGREINADIVFMLEEYQGLKDGYCILGFQIH